MFKLLKDFLGWTPSSGVRSPSSSALLFPNTGQRMGKQVTRMHVNLSACVQPGWAYMAYLRILERFVWGESSIFHLVRHPRTDAIRVAMVVLSTKASTWSKQGHHGREEVPTADARSILFFDASIQAANLWPALLVCFESFPAKSWLNGFGRVGAWMVRKLNTSEETKLIRRSMQTGTRRSGWQSTPCGVPPRKAFMCIVHTHVVLTSHCFYFILDNLAVVFGMRERERW
jgi:hypothetical protein